MKANECARRVKLAMLGVASHTQTLTNSDRQKMTKSKKGVTRKKTKRELTYAHMHNCAPTFFTSSSSRKNSKLKAINNKLCFHTLSRLASKV